MKRLACCLVAIAILVCLVCSIAGCDRRGSCVVGFSEKQTVAPGAVAWLNAGAYVVEREMIDRLAPDQPCSLEREAFPELLRSGGRIAALTSEEPFFDIGTPEGLAMFAAFYAGLSGSRQTPHRMTA